LLAARIGHFEEHPLNARLAVGSELRGVGRRRKYANGKRFWIAPGRRGRRRQPLHRRLWLEAPASARKPAVAKLHHPVQGVIAFAAEKQRGMRLLLGLRIDPNGIEVDEFPLVL